MSARRTVLVRRPQCSIGRRHRLVVAVDAQAAVAAPAILALGLRFPRFEGILGRLFARFAPRTN
ncbi:MAG: hypothetical protein H7269_12795 [Cellulomonas sp.]|nr:hypothetical protein [Cellulomonas sp.]